MSKNVNVNAVLDIEREYIVFALCGKCKSFGIYCCDDNPMLQEAWENFKKDNLFHTGDCNGKIVEMTVYKREVTYNPTMKHKVQ